MIEQVAVPVGAENISTIMDSFFYNSTTFLFNPETFVSAIYNMFWVTPLALSYEILLNS